MKNTVRWGILATGVIARNFAVIGESKFPPSRCLPQERS